MADFNFQGNAKQLYEALIKAPPFPLRPMIKKALSGALERRVGAAQVNPQDVIQAVHDSTPGPFLKGAIKAVSGMHKCATRCEKCGGDCPLSP